MMHSLVVFCIFILICNVQTVVITNLEKYCSDDVIWVACSGLNFTGIHDLEFEVQQKFSFDDVRFSQSSFSVIPKNTFAIANIDRLDMTNCGVEELNQDDFKNANNLKRLTLANNKIKVLNPEVFVHLNLLNYLDLENNQISEIYDNSLNGLDNLQSLFLEQNNIRNVPKNLLSSLKSLNRINLSDNNLEILDDEVFAKNQNLTEIYLKYNHLKILDERVYTNHKALQFMMQNFNSDTKVQSMQFLMHLTRVEKLHIDGNYFPHISGKTFSHFVKLRELNLSSTQLSGIEVDAFHGYDDLINLDLSCNGLEQINIESILPLKELRSLSINNNNLTEINYRKLLESNPIRVLKVANNNWSCSYLSQMMSFLRVTRIGVDTNPYQTEVLENHVYGIACLPTTRKNASATTEASITSSTTTTNTINQEMIDSIRYLSKRKLVELEHLKEIETSLHHEFRNMVEILTENHKNSEYKLDTAKLDIYAVIILCNISIISIYIIYKLIASKFKKRKSKGHHSVLPNQFDTSELIERSY